MNKPLVTAKELDILEELAYMSRFGEDGFSTDDSSAKEYTEKFTGMIPSGSWNNPQNEDSETFSF